MVRTSSGVGLVARIIVGQLADTYSILNSMILCSFATSLSYLGVWLHTMSFTYLAIITTAHGVFGGLSIMLYPVSATRVAPESQLTSALG
ncbi:hypothetical protein BGZ79_003112, partial [Entomortierella chlamydospora]